MPQLEMISKAKATVYFMMYVINKQETVSCERWVRKELTFYLINLKYIIS